MKSHLKDRLTLFAFNLLVAGYLIGYIVGHSGHHIGIVWITIVLTINALATIEGYFLLRKGL